MNLKNLENELNTLHSIFSKNEEKIGQLTHRESYLRSKLMELAKQ